MHTSFSYLCSTSEQVHEKLHFQIPFILIQRAHKSLQQFQPLFRLFGTCIHVYIIYIYTYSIFSYYLNSKIDKPCNKLTVLCLPATAGCLSEWRWSSLIVASETTGESCFLIFLQCQVALVRLITGDINKCYHVI